MYMLMVDDICMEPEILKIILFIKTLLDVIKVLVPIILIVLGMLDFAKATIAADEQKMSEYKDKFVRRLIASVLIFFIPVTVDFVFKNIDNADIFEDACWSAATKENIEIVTAEAKERRKNEEQQYKEWYQKNLANISENTAVGSGATGNASQIGGDDGATTTGNTESGKIVKYALSFVGHPYVYGGQTLCTDWKTKTGCGVDCSSFVQAVYKKFGYSIPRTALAQSSGNDYSLKGKKIKVTKITEFGKNNKNLKPGDLLFYRGTCSDGICHVTMYIGSNKVVHASSSRTGIIKSDFNYRTASWAIRISKD